MLGRGGGDGRQWGPGGNPGATHCIVGEHTGVAGTNWGKERRELTREHYSIVCTVQTIRVVPPLTNNRKRTTTQV